MHRLGIIAIGRNEGPRLQRGLESVLGRAAVIDKPVKAIAVQQETVPPKPSAGLATGAAEVEVLQHEVIH